MTTQIQRRRGTTAQHSTFTGAVGEITVDTDKEVLVVHDGTQAGGYPQMRENGSNSALALGSAATPSLKFTGDTNTGIYSPGADQVSVATGGTERLRIDSTGQIESVSLGTAAAPAYTWVGDPNTGIYSPGADQVAISTNGTGRLFVDASGRVGVGTASPADSLHIFSSGAVRLRMQGATPQIRLYSPDGSTNQYYIGANISDTVNGGLFIGAGPDISGGTSRIGINSAGTTTISSNAATAPLITTIGGSEVARIDGSGRLGLGTSSPQKLLEISSTTDATIRINDPATIGAVNRYIGGIEYYTNDASGGAKVACSVKGYHVDISGRGKLAFATGEENVAMTIDGSQRVGIGTTAPSNTLHLSAAANHGITLERTGTNTGGVILNVTSFGAAEFKADNTFNIQSGTNAPIVFNTSGATERARIDSSGRLLVGTSSAVTVAGLSCNLQEEGTSGGTSSASLIRNSANSSSAFLVFGKTRGTSNGSVTSVSDGDQLGGLIFAGADGTNLSSQGAAIGAFVDGTPGAGDMPGRLVFSTTADGASSPTERMRIQARGDVLINAAQQDIAFVNGVGASFSATGNLELSQNATHAARINRKTDDGNLVLFTQDGTIEGTISVSGTTVSYNGAHLSRWSQLPGGATREEILRGSVLSNIDEMCAWGEEDNEQLNRMKVSDVEGDPNVAGVFQAWDDDDDTYTDDFYCAMTGDFIIRIAEGVTVQRGDLLMSAGDGTAKPQDDDIIRSKTIAKVTSTHVTCIYDDGSYCVPCVLMAC
jgi:Major tropism determinant N-terminal domain